MKMRLAICACSFLDMTNAISRLGDNGSIRRTLRKDSRSLIAKTKNKMKPKSRCRRGTKSLSWTNSRKRLLEWTKNRRKAKLTISKLVLRRKSRRKSSKKSKKKLVLASKSRECKLRSIVRKRPSFSSRRETMSSRRKKRIIRDNRSRSH